MTAQGSERHRTRDLTKANREEVLRHLTDGAQLSRVEIARRSGLSPATVNRLTASMQKSGLLREVGEDLTTGGRPSILLELDPQARRMLAFDITPYQIEIAETDVLGTILTRQSQPIAPAELGDSVRLLIEAIAGYVAGRAADAPPVVAIGISIPGPVTDEQVVTVAPALGWNDVDLQAALSPLELPCAPSVENDVNLIAFGEYFCGLDPRPQSLLTIATFDGVGAGIVEEERLWRGRGGVAGQFGRMLLDISGLKRGREGYGQAESRLGSSALLARAVEAGVFAPGEGSAEQFFELAAEGREPAKELFDRVMDEYAFTLVNFCAVVAPEVVVFDGLLGRWSSLVLPALRSRLRGNVLSEPELRPAALQGDGKLVGAALYALDRSGGLLSLA